MKASLSTPVQSAIIGTLKSLHKERPVLVPVESAACWRPLEIRRYVRNLRRNRQYNYTSDFIY